MVQKIVINACHGGFSLSEKGLLEMAKHVEGKEVNLTEQQMRKMSFYFRFIQRDDPILIKIIEDLGEEANGQFSQLKIVEIPDDIEWEIEEYDGKEWISEKHKTWE